LLLGASLAMWAGCRKPEPIPTQKCLVASGALAPGIDELLPHKNANRRVYQGDVFTERKRLPEFAWEAMLDGQVLQRTGAIEVLRAEVDGPMFVFASDFIEGEVPTTGWLCGRMGEPQVFGMPCAQTLRRIVAPKGRLVAYATCPGTDCPLAQLSAGAVTTRQVPGLSEVRVQGFGQHQLLLAWSRWVREPSWTGGTLLVLQLSPPLAPAGEVPLDEIDARKPEGIVNRLGTLELLGDGVRFSGTRAVRELSTGRELSSEAFDERYGISAEGQLVRR
jgi:hypothetical protein